MCVLCIVFVGGARSVGLVAGEQSGVHRLHAAGAREAAHQPVVDALHVVGVHARQVAHLVADEELHHADDALACLLAAIISAGGQVLNEPNAFGYLHLLLLGELTHGTRYTWRWMVHRRSGLYGQRFLQKSPDLIRLQVV